MKWKFNENVKVTSSELWYDLTDGGYIDPDRMLLDSSQAAKVNKAIELIEDFLQSAVDADVLDYI